MNVLFLLSCLEPAGSETYCVSLAKAWGSDHRMFWISDRLHFGQSYQPMPIHKKAFPEGLRNALRVADFVRDHAIDVIHSHSRRANWVAAQASYLTKVPYVTTIHQPPPVHFFSKVFPCLGDHTLAIDEAVADHLRKYFGTSIKQLNLVRNGIFIPPPQQGAKGGATKRVLLLGRLTGGRWQGFQFFLSALTRMVEQLPATIFQIVGRIPEERKAELHRQIAQANEVIAPSFLEAAGFVSPLDPLLETCDAVVAGGRSALESLARGKPVIILGEGGVLGLCTPETIEEARRTNFGDHLTGDRFYPAVLEVALRDVLQDRIDRPELARWGRQQVETYYNIQAVAEQVDNVYRRLVKRS